MYVIIPSSPRSSSFTIQNVSIKSANPSLNLLYSVIFTIQNVSIKYSSEYLVAHHKT